MAITNSVDDGDWIIIGDIDKYQGCLIATCGKNLDNAEKSLNRMIKDPNDNDKRLIEGYKNLRLKLVKPDDCWWRYGLD